MFTGVLMGFRMFVALRSSKEGLGVGLLTFLRIHVCSPQSVREIPANLLKGRRV